MSSPIETIFGSETGASVDQAPDGTRKGFVAEDPTGMYLLLGVADYDGSGASSYLRLGMPAAGAGALGPPSATGEDLASLVQGFTDDARDRGDGTSATGPAPAETLMSGLTEGSPIAAAGRVNESGAPLPTASAAFHHLHRRGGVRDHTDGNRVTTTRGDKVEIIRGNYKLLVLGRQRTAHIDTDAAARRAVVSHAAGVEMSGGLPDTDGRDLPFPDMGGRALDVSYAWGQDSDGTWGWKQTTLVGDDNGNASMNDRVISNTWVDYQDTQVGSFSKPVSSISQSTYASQMSTLVDATVQTVVTAGPYFVIPGEIFTNTDALATIDTSKTWFSTALRVVLEMGEADLGVLFAVGKAGIIQPNLMVGVVCDDKVGPHFDVHIGAHIDTHAGVHVEDTFGEHTDTHNGMHTDVHVGLHLDQHFGAHIEDDQAPVSIADNTITVGQQHFTVAQFRAGTAGGELKSVLTTALNLADQYHIYM